MRTKRISFIGIIVLALTLSACSAGGDSTPTPTAVDINSIFTEVVATITEQAAEFTPTETATPTETPTIAMTPTIASDLTATLPGVGSNGSGLCDDSTYVSDVTIPDNTQVLPGQTFQKTWKIQNAGSCAWNTSYSIGFLSGEQMGGAKTNLTSSVNPGYQIEVTVNMTAPSTVGTYTGKWILSNAGGTNFGAWVSVTIVVSNSASTLTPSSATSMPTATNTPNS
jgi:hypothetical protein